VVIQLPRSRSAATAFAVGADPSRSTVRGCAAPAVFGPLFFVDPVSVFSPSVLYTRASRPQRDGEANIRNGGSGTASGSSSVDADVVWATFPAVFLRDNCASAVHPKTRQRTVLVWELPPDLSIVTATWGHRQLPDGGIAAAGTGAPQEASMVLEVEWSDGATSTFDHQWLCDHQLYQEEDAGDTFTRAAALEMQPWRVADLPDGAGALPEVDFAAVMADDAELLRLLDAICTVGVARVTSMPDGDPEAGAMLANRIGHGQPTVYV